MTISAGMYGLKNKPKLAIETGAFIETVGVDLVATCVNDIVAKGGHPCSYMDFDSHELEAHHSSKVLSGIDFACHHCNVDFLESEFAVKKSLPIYDPERKLGGVPYGSVRTDSLIHGNNIDVGDVLIGLPSRGPHSHGFFLAKRALEQSGSSLTDNLPGTNITLGESLMFPTPLYVYRVFDIISKGGVKGIAQVKGGLAKSILSVFPMGLGADIFNHSWIVPPIFKWIQKAGRVEEVAMREYFNMGIGMVLVVSKDSAERITGEHEAFVIGKVVSGGGVRYT